MKKIQPVSVPEAVCPNEQVVASYKETPKISPITFEFNNEGLNSLRDKINEIIKKISK